MATLKIEDFESGLSGYTNTGSAATSTAQFYDGANSLLLQCTGAAKNIRMNSGFEYSAGHRTHVSRFYVYLTVDTSGSASIWQCSNANGNAIIQLRVGRKMRLIVGGTNGADSAALNLSQWYRIDVKFDCSADPATATWQIDGSTQYTVNDAGAAADISSIIIGNTATNTYTAYVDAWKVTDVLADYPLGPLGSGPITATAVQATGTGAASVAPPSLKPSAVQATGTGAASASSAALRPTAVAAAGTGAASVAPPALRPTAVAASGTGAASVFTANLSTGAIAASGTGASSPSSAALRPTAVAASGTGAADVPTTAQDTTAVAVQATGTGSASPSTTAVAASSVAAAGTGAASPSAAALGVQAVPAAGTGAAGVPTAPQLKTAFAVQATGVAAVATFSSATLQIAANPATGIGSAGTVAVTRTATAAVSGGGTVTYVRSKGGTGSTVLTGAGTVVPVVKGNRAGSSVLTGSGAIAAVVTGNHKSVPNFAIVDINDDLDAFVVSGYAVGLGIDPDEFILYSVRGSTDADGEYTSYGTAWTYDPIGDDTTVFSAFTTISDFIPDGRLYPWGAPLITAYGDDDFGHITAAGEAVATNAVTVSGSGAIVVAARRGGSSTVVLTASGSVLETHIGRHAQTFTATGSGSTVATWRGVHRQIAPQPIASVDTSNNTFRVTGAPVGNVNFFATISVRGHATLDAVYEPAFVVYDSVSGTTWFFVGPPLSGTAGGGFIHVNSPTGGGSVTPARTPTRSTTAVLTGSGSIASTYAHARFASVTITGSGVAQLSTQKSGFAQMTGGGTAVSVHSGAHFGSAVLTGAGTTVPVAAGRKSGATVLSGGGTVTAAVLGAHRGSTTLTASGSVSYTFAGSLTKTGAAVITGGGIALPALRAARTGSSVLTGSGSITWTAQIVHNRTLIVTGGGEVTATGSKTPGLSGRPARVVRGRRRSTATVRARQVVTQGRAR